MERLHEKQWRGHASHVGGKKEGAERGERGFSCVGMPSRTRLLPEEGLQAKHQRQGEKADWAFNSI